MRFILLASLCLTCVRAMSQSGQPEDAAISSKEISADQLTRLGTKYDRLSKTLNHSSLRLLMDLQVQELNIEKQVANSPSLVSTKALQSDNAVYQQLKAALLKTGGLQNLSPLQEYIPHLDSLQTAIRFLQSKASLLRAPQLQSLESLNGKLASLQSQLQQANNIQGFIQQRQQALEAQLQQLGAVNKLLGFKKQVYYYRTQLQGYKHLANDPEALSKKVLSIVLASGQFQRFFQNNSYLSHLFSLPGSSHLADTGKGAPGLQTRAAVAALIQTKMGPGANLANAAVAAKTGLGGGDNPLTSSMQKAEGLIDGWKAKISAVGGGSSDAPMPDFQPNSQRNKTFLKRLQLSFDIQSQPSSTFVPALSTIGLNIGYKLSDRSIAGVGAAYLLGWGQPFNHIAFSSQGASLRSFFDWKWKGSLWLSGGYEANYYSAFTRIPQLYSISAWQQSALVGLMKTTKIGNKSANVQLLFDLLYRQHVPPTQPIVFRFGYSFN